MFDKLLYYLIMLLMMSINIPIFFVGFILLPLKCLGYGDLYIKSMMHVINLFFFVINIIFIKSKCIEHRDIDKTKRYVWMYNHQSLLDTLLKHHVWGMHLLIATNYVKYIPFIGQNLMMIDGYFRKPNEKNNLVKVIIDILNKKKYLSFSLFPEGGIHYDGFNVDVIKSGGFVIAKEANIDIIPVYHNIKDKINGKDNVYHNKKAIYIIIGKPICVKNKSIDDIKHEYINRMLYIENNFDHIVANHKLSDNLIF